MSFDHTCRVQSSQCIIREITKLLLNITVATDGLLCLKNASTQISMIGLGKCYQKTSNKKCHMADFGLVHCRTVVQPLLRRLRFKAKTWHIGEFLSTLFVTVSIFQMRSTQEIHTHSKLGYACIKVIKLVKDWQVFAFVHCLSLFAYYVALFFVGLEVS